jgi:hypothetical protein
MKKNLILTALFTLTVCFCVAQVDIKGFTYHGGPGIIKSEADIRAFESKHPVPPDFIPPLRPELNAPEPRSQHPDSKAVSQFGTMVTATTTITPLVAVTQKVWSNFLTIWGNYGTAIPGRESPYTPPDNCGDVGFTQVMATANTRLKVFNKPSVISTAVTTPTGTSTTTLTAVANIELNAFFANPALGISGISDPHVRFDRLSGRWFVVAIDVNHNVNNYCCVAVSNGSTVTSAANFKIFYFNVSQTGGSSRDFFDYPTLGVDKNYLYIGGNMFRNSSSFSGCNMWVVDKAKLIAGSLTVTGFPQTLTGTNMYTPQGVHNDDAAPTKGFFIGSSQTVYSKLVIRRVNYGTTPTLSGDLTLITSTVYSPKTVPTLGGTSIDGGDWRLYAAMIKKNKITGVNSLWVAQGTRLNKSGIGGSTGDRDGALWLEIGNLTGTPAILQSANLFDAVNATSSAIYYTYPTIATNGQGHSLMGFTSAGPAKFCQAGIASRYRTNAIATFNTPVDFTTTGSAYNPGANRWGDFTQTVVDPSDDMTMWTFTEYVPTTNAWGVRAGQFKAPPPANPSLAAIPVCGTSTVTINGTSVNNSEFFDPGTGFSKRLRVTVKGHSAIAVSNVVFLSPTKITATFNRTGAGTGNDTLTVINPDGQSRIAIFTLLSGCPLIAARSLSTDINNTEFKNQLRKVYPNPAASILNYEIESTTDQRVLVELYDIAGQKVLNQTQEITKGINTKQLSIARLNKAAYYLQVIDAQNNVIGRVKVVKE